MDSRTAAQYEALLARAHQQIHRAAVLMDRTHNYGHARDCEMLADELRRLMSDSLAGRHRVLRGQMTFPGVGPDPSVRIPKI
jgi:hypothetical protein